MDTTQTTNPAPLLPTNRDYERIDRNRDRQHPGHVDECFLCGKGLTAEGAAKAWHVEVTQDGQAIHADERWTRTDSQGAYPVGSECARSIPAAYKFPAAYKVRAV